MDPILIVLKVGGPGPCSPPVPPPMAALLTDCNEEQPSEETRWKSA